MGAGATFPRFSGAGFADAPRPAANKSFMLCSRREPAPYPDRTSQSNLNDVSLPTPGRVQAGRPWLPDIDAKARRRSVNERRRVRSVAVNHGGLTVISANPTAMRIAVVVVPSRPAVRGRGGAGDNSNHEGRGHSNSRHEAGERCEPGARPVLRRGADLPGHHDLLCYLPLSRSDHAKPELGRSYGTIQTPHRRPFSAVPASRHRASKTN